MAIQMFPSSYTRPTFGGKLGSIENRFELDPEDIRQLPKRLGQGHYGEVWEACWTNSETRKRIRVAMKTPKDSRITTKKELDSQIYSIRKEIKVLAYVGEHEYVLRLIGAVTNNPENICMVTEFCEIGSLQDFLKDKKLRGLFVDEIVSKQYENHSIDSTFTTTFIAQTLPEWAADFKKRRESGKITTSDLLAFSYQIATGMIFLHEKQVLHRDLALRNILLKSDFTIKIADFGLSRITKGGAYIVGNPKAALPIVSPPEATPPVGGAVSLKADWWTFGVLLWEIFNLGAEEPFEKSRSSRLSMINFLENGNQLNYPKFAPHEIFELMKELWIMDPDDRVGLTECLRKIKMQLKISCPPLVNELTETDKKIKQHQEEQQRKQQQQQLQEQESAGLAELEAMEDHLLFDPSSLQTEKHPILPPQKFTRTSDASVNRSKKLQQASRKKRTYCCAVFSAIAVLATITLLIWLFRESILPKDPLISANETDRTTVMLKTAMNDCYDWLHLNKNTSNGIYEINPNGSQPFYVYCDMESNGGGWTVFQRRTHDNAFDFSSKSWAEYKHGFNDAAYENFWLGNDNIHTLSSKDRLVLLRIDLWGEQPEEQLFGEYNNFQILNSLKNYTLSISNVLLGNATAKNTLGSIVYNNGQPFSTIDRNNQGYCFDSKNTSTCTNNKCTKRRRTEPCQDYCSGYKHEMGGWWIDPNPSPMQENQCGYVSLNGKPRKLWDMDASTTKFIPYRSEMKLRRQP